MGKYKIIIYKGLFLVSVSACIFFAYSFVDAKKEFEDMSSYEAVLKSEIYPLPMSMDFIAMVACLIAAISCFREVKKLKNAAN